MFSVINVLNIVNVRKFLNIYIVINEMLHEGGIIKEPIHFISEVPLLTIPVRF